LCAVRTGVNLCRMTMNRRAFLGLAGTAAFGLVTNFPRARTQVGRGAFTEQLVSDQRMYGIIGSITAVSGQRDALVRILLEGIAGMPGCLSYVVALDPSDPDLIWITEVWESQASHERSLEIPAVREAIGRARPLIAGFGERTVTLPVGGHGLSPA
jgi:quinol monooxygenase YgiN